MQVHTGFSDLTKLHAGLLHLPWNAPEKSCQQTPWYPLVICDIKAPDCMRSGLHRLQALDTVDIVLSFAEHSSSSVAALWRVWDVIRLTSLNLDPDFPFTTHCIMIGRDLTAFDIQRPHSGLSTTYIGQRYRLHISQKNKKRHLKVTIFLSALLRISGSFSSWSGLWRREAICSNAVSYPFSSIPELSLETFASK